MLASVAHSDLFSTLRRGISSKDIKGVASLIISGAVKNIVTMTGAGISVAAGIPDFRSKGGLYSMLDKYDLAEPSDILDIDYFLNRPEPFYDICPSLLPGKHSPTLAHQFIRLLSEKGLLLRDYTQNIDGLERRAGIPPAKLVESHGTFDSAHCTRCSRKYSLGEIEESLMKGKVLHCRKKNCDGMIKPDIVFYGEAVPDRFFDLSSKDLPQCDLLLIIGTSLMVYPFASLAKKVRNGVPRVLINNEKVEEAYGNFHFDEQSNFHDVFLGGDCQSTVRKLVEELGWKADLSAQRN